MIRQAFARLTALVRRRHLDAELDSEIQAHLELAERDALSAGLTRDEARREARLQFGSIEPMREAHRDARSTRWVETTTKDVRHGLLLLRRAPGFACAAKGERVDSAQARRAGYISGDAHPAED